LLLAFSWKSAVNDQDVAQPNVNSTSHNAISSSRCYVLGDADYTITDYEVEL